MNNGFWDTLFATGNPVVGLSPMDGVTDAAMRHMTAKHGQPDILFTEFISVDALSHAKEVQSVDRVMRTFMRAKDVGKLAKEPYEIAQVFGHTPELFYQAAVMIGKLGFDGMDINMGCPMHKVEDQGSGAGLIRTPEVAKEIVRQAKQGMADWAAGKVKISDLIVSEEVKKWVYTHAQHKIEKVALPVSVKTRVGVDSIVVEEWMEHLMEVRPANISLHGRTLRQLYQGSADWEAIGRAAGVVHKHGGHILGNGDVLSLQDGMDKVKQFGVDGFLIGRFAEGNPGIFLQGMEPCNKEQQLTWMLEHVRVYESIYKPELEVPGDVRWFMPMRKHLAWYCKGFPGASELRSRLMLTNNVEEVGEIIKNTV